MPYSQHGSRYSQQPSLIMIRHCKYRRVFFFNPLQLKLLIQVWKRECESHYCVWHWCTAAQCKWVDNTVAHSPAQECKENRRHLVSIHPCRAAPAGAAKLLALHANWHWRDRNSAREAARPRDGAPILYLGQRIAVWVRFSQRPSLAIEIERTTVCLFLTQFTHFTSFL